jgi:hypothetical protein
MAVSNTAVGAVSAIPISPGGVGSPSQPFLIVGQGTFTANGVTAVVVADAGCTANSQYVFTLQSLNSGTPSAAPYLSAVTAGTGFSVKCGSGDTGIYSWLRLG